MLKSEANGSDKLKAFQDAIGRLERRFGKGTIMQLGEATWHSGIEVIPTGSLSLDAALGTGGIPRGRVTEIFGPESSGKSTLTHHLIGEVHKKGGLAVYVDVEHAFDPAYATECGVIVDHLFIAQPDWGEQALEIAEEVVRSGAVDLVVIDSVAALAPRGEVDGYMGEVHVGLQARLMSQAMRKLCAANGHGQAAIVFTNQLRERVGVVLGSREFTPGGRALKFYASVRIDLRILESIKDGEKWVGNRIVARVVKNKLAPPFRSARFDIIFGQGISREGEVVDLGTELGVVKKNGSWYQWNGHMLGQGREAAKQFLKEHLDIEMGIEKVIRAELGLIGQD